MASARPNPRLAPPSSDPAAPTQPKLELPTCLPASCHVYAPSRTVAAYAHAPSKPPHSTTIAHQNPLPASAPPPPPAPPPLSQVYAPSRTVVVYAPSEFCDKDADRKPTGVPGLAVKGLGPYYSF